MPEFGTDLSCVHDLSADGRVVTGFQLVGEAVARRWLTPRGRLIGDPNYGFDLTAYVNEDTSDRDLAALRAGAAAEAEKDERVDSCDVTAELDVNGTLTVVGKCETSEGPFTLTVAVDSVTVTLLSVE